MFMEANCFSLFSIILCRDDLTLPSVIRDLGLTQSWNFGIQRFLVSRYFGWTGQSWADPEQVFKGLPGKQRHSHFLHPCFWFFQCYLQSLEIYLSPSFQKYRVSTEQYSWCEILIHQTQHVLSALQLSVQWFPCILGEHQKMQTTDL